MLENQLREGLTISFRSLLGSLFWMALETDRELNQALWETYMKRIQAQHPNGHYGDHVISMLPFELVGDTLQSIFYRLAGLKRMMPTSRWRRIYEYFSDYSFLHHFERTSDGYTSDRFQIFSSLVQVSTDLAIDFWKRYCLFLDKTGTKFARLNSTKMTGQIYGYFTPKGLFMITNKHLLNLAHEFLVSSEQFRFLKDNIQYTIFGNLGYYRQNQPLVTGYSRALWLSSFINPDFYAFVLDYNDKIYLEYFVPRNNESLASYLKTNDCLMEFLLAHAFRKNYKVILATLKNLKKFVCCVVDRKQEWIDFFSRYDWFLLRVLRCFFPRKDFLKFCAELGHLPGCMFIDVTVDAILLENPLRFPAIEFGRCPHYYAYELQVNVIRFMCDPSEAQQTFENRRILVSYSLFVSLIN